jgi:serine protease Do
LTVDVSSPRAIGAMLFAVPNARFAAVPLFLLLSPAASAAPAASAPAAPVPAPPVMTSTKPAAPPPPAAGKTPATPAPPTAVPPPVKATTPAPAAAPVPAGANPKAAPVTAAFSPGSGLVVLERGGKALGVGTILNTDGRILTALSILGDGRSVDVRYADGGRATARIGHADRARDLALLVPQSGWHKQGLKASNGAPSGPLRAFTGGPHGAAPGARVTLKGAGAFRGMDGKPLTEALELATPLDPASAGTPLVDDAGEVHALVTRACRPATSGACMPIAVALPVGPIREFLRVTPASATLPVPHIGIRGIAEDAGSVRGVRVTIVAPGSPAAAAGLRAGKDLASSDVLVAIDGVPIITPETLRTTVGEHSVGDVLDLLLFTAGRFRHVTVVVAAAPANAK